MKDFHNIFFTNAKLIGSFRFKKLKVGYFLLLCLLSPSFILHSERVFRRSSAEQVFPKFS